MHRIDMATLARKALAAFAVLLALTAIGAGASAAPMTDSERKQAQADARKAALNGPTDVPMADQAVLHLPAGMAFIPQPQAGKLLTAMGNPGAHQKLQGLVFPTSEAEWFATVDFEASGYVKDDDAKDWNADDLLKSYREGTESANEERVAMGAPALEILGWAQTPTYDAATHRLAWAMSSRNKGAAAGEPQGVNYNTYALGRDGYYSLNLITDLDELPKYKPQANALLEALAYNDGKRYADFNPDTDHVAEYGLAALVVGVAAKKLGFLALVLGLGAKFAKVGFLLLIGIGAAARKLLKRKQATPTPPPQA